MAKRKRKIQKKRKVKFIKDPATINFLLEHLEPVKIDFPKIPIWMQDDFPKLNNT